MTDIVKLQAEISKPDYEGMTPDQILAAIKAPTLDIPPPPPKPTKYSIEDALGLGDVSPADIAEAQKVVSP